MLLECAGRRRLTTPAGLLLLGVLTPTFGARAASPAAATKPRPAGTPSLKLTVSRSFPVAQVGQQGIATDGKCVYVQCTSILLKYDLKGKLLAKSDRARLHHGGITHHDGRIYAAVSKCAKTATRKHWVYVYDAANLKRLAVYDVGDRFEICAGGIARHDGHFYVAESYYDSDHDDYLVVFDADFKAVRSHRIAFKCPYGIQGLDYLPALGKFMVNSHGREFYLIDPDFDVGTLRPGLAPFALQDVACLKGSTVLINDRAGKRVVFARVDGISDDGQ